MNALAGASRRARRTYRSKAFQNAYVKGARAALAGRPIDVCPYRADAHKTWGNSYRQAWLRGFTSIKGGMA